jgi:hypothetical protein
MRLTVGPLSPSVYWRRRAVVAGAIVAVIMILAYSCSGGDDPAKKPGAQPTASGNASQTGIGAGGTPPPSVIMPNPSDPSSGLPPNAGNNNTGTNTDIGATGETCTDAELSVVSAAESTSVRQGYPVKFFIRIKNISTRTCVRDVGAQMQELYLEQGTAKQWSSDACGDQGGTADVRQFPPSHEREYYLVWEGKSTAKGCTAQPLMNTGAYQLRGRLGNKVSEPVTVTITA